MTTYNISEHPFLVGTFRALDFPLNMSPGRVVRPKNVADRPGEEAGLLYNAGSAVSLLILHPNMGTGVIEHPRGIWQTARALGSIDGLVIPADQKVLFHKYQEGDASQRDETRDKVERYATGAEFCTLSPERSPFYGLHNGIKDGALAVLLQTRR